MEALEPYRDGGDTGEVSWLSRGVGYDWGRAAAGFRSATQVSLSDRSRDAVGAVGGAFFGATA